MPAPIEPGGSLLVAWQLRGRRAVLVGGGDVAAGRLVHLKNADACVTLIAPRAELCDEVRLRLEAGVIDTYRDARLGAPEEIGECDMVLTAIDDADMSRRVCAWCRARRIPVNVADVPAECDFYFGSVIRRGPLQVLVSTGGMGPRLARLVRERLERALPPSVGRAIERVGQLRQALRAAAPEQSMSGARMRWMSRVCDTWPLERLAELDDAGIARLLDGWRTGTVPRPRPRPRLAYLLAGVLIGALGVGLAILPRH